MACGAGGEGRGRGGQRAAATRPHSPMRALSAPRAPPPTRPPAAARLPGAPRARRVAAPATAAAPRDHAAAARDASRGQALLDWLKVWGDGGGRDRAQRGARRRPTRPDPRPTPQSNGAPATAVTLASVEVEGRPLDVVVASRPVKAGERVLEIPERLVITLDKVFQDAELAELLSGAKKVPVLAQVRKKRGAGSKKKQNKNTHPHIALPSPSPQLALYLMYEKKQKDASCWKPLLDELDRIQGRGPSGAKSPLLWDAGQAADLLAGSPILGELAAREAAMRTEWDQMDDVWCGGEGEGKVWGMGPSWFFFRERKKPSPRSPSTGSSRPRSSRATPLTPPRPRSRSTCSNRPTACASGEGRGGRDGGGGGGGGAARGTDAPPCAPPSPPRSVQSAVVHLMGVPPAARFALVPLGPPLLRYSATARTTLKWDPAAAAVVLEADRDLAPGDPVVAW